SGNLGLPRGLVAVRPVSGTSLGFRSCVGTGISCMNNDATSNRAVPPDGGLGQPLSGLTVIEAGEGVAVAYCGKVLADFGATVIKVEEPGSHDPVRTPGPGALDGDAPLHL